MSAPTRDEIAAVLDALEKGCYSDTLCDCVEHRLANAWPETRAVIEAAVAWRAVCGPFPMPDEAEVPDTDEGCAPPVRAMTRALAVWLAKAKEVTK